MNKNYIVILGLSLIILGLLGVLYYKLSYSENYLVGINNPDEIRRAMTELPACSNKQNINDSITCTQLLSEYENKVQHPIFDDRGLDGGLRNDNLMMQYCCCDPSVKPLETLPADLQKQVDALRACPVDCVVSDYTWGTCDSMSGTQQGTRTITTQPMNGGAPCPSLTTSKNCPVDCVVSDYTWGACDPMSGTHMGTRNIVTPPLNGGAPCPSVQVSQPCPVDCVVSDWNQGNCDPVTSMQMNNRTIIVPSQNSGAPCPELTQSVSCQPTPVPSSNLRRR